MSRQNLDLVLESTRRFVARDLPGLAALYTPDAVGVAPEGWPESGRFQGREALMAQYVRLWEGWEDQRVDAQRSISEGDWVVVEWLTQMRGAASGVSGELTVSATYRIEDGRIARVQWFWDWDEARKAMDQQVEEDPSPSDLR